jgi:hypothetical protein
VFDIERGDLRDDDASRRFSETKPVRNVEL